MWNDTRQPPDHGHGWLLHGLRAPDQATIAHAELACDDEFVGFLTARLDDEVQAALRRQRARCGASGRIFTGLRLLREVIDDLGRGRLPDDITLDLVISAYAAHPDFQTRWRTPTDLVPAAPTITRSAS